MSGCAYPGSPPRMRGKLTPAAVDQYGNGITPADAGKTGFCTCGAACTGDHPRGCGENCMMWNPLIMTKGSPPRMRGKHLKSRGFRRRTRITPADAGKTLLFHVPNEGQRDHPRGCGENLKPHLAAAFGAGSPPRMRGKPQASQDVQTAQRITPADAGKTFMSSKTTGICRDHPRGCGENRPTSRRLMVSRGSPPRMRGKRP